ncbi:MAG: DHA2 family efflux MFS transporter permease subunit [Azospirillaceae bacterium]|nr:DHA2 family efflux MFS transporter permease subunit [Azospirillaceae bacterium]
MTAGIPEVAPDRADAAAWLAVAAGTIGALMATLDSAIVNASLPTIQGEIGASSSEGTWVSTAYLVAEVVMIPMAGWFERILGLRTLLLIATTLFTLFSMWCGVSTSLVQMIVGRVGQGFTGGAMIPTALTIVSTRLSPRQRPIGIALFGMTMVLGPSLGPIVGGWLTENISWHYAFFLNLPIGAGLVALLFLGLAAGKIRWHELLDTDGLGIAGLVFGLGCLTIVLEEGQREQWFQSEMIRELSAVSLVGFCLLLAGQFVARKPVIRLRILLDRNFCGAFVLNLAVGAALYGILYIIPQFLAAVPGYNAEQAGFVATLSGVPQLLMLALFPLLLRVLDIRVVVAFGFLLFGVSCYMNAHVTPDSAGDQFFWSQVLRGFGQFFTLYFLGQAASAGVPVEYAADASGLFNAARNLGGSFGLAMVATLREQRATFHFARLTEAITANSLAGQDAAQRLGVAQLGRMIEGQAIVMTYADLYWVFGAVLILMIPLVLLLRPSRRDGGTGAAT